MAFTMVYSVASLFVDSSYLPKKQIMEAGGVMISSVVMGILLAFRTNSAYDRWWEGRKLWGQLVNDIRNLSLKVASFSGVAHQRKRRFYDLLKIFPRALKNHLRGLPPDEEVLKFVPEGVSAPHVPLLIAARIQNIIIDWEDDKFVNGFEQLILDPHVRALMDICGACERILKTPIFGTYKDLIWIGLTIYILVLPWLLIPVVHAWCLPMIFVTAYFIFGLELVSEEVEEPFGQDINDLPLDSICTTIADSGSQIEELDARDLL